MTKNGSKGQGWHGHSDEHAKAGRKGGLARAKNLKARKQKNNEDAMAREEDSMPDIF